jgi:hypothetical protein
MPYHLDISKYKGLRTTIIYLGTLPKNGHFGLCLFGRVGFCLAGQAQLIVVGHTHVSVDQLCQLVKYTVTYLGSIWSLILQQVCSYGNSVGSQEQKEGQCLDALVSLLASYLLIFHQSQKVT